MDPWRLFAFWHNAQPFLCPARGGIAHRVARIGRVAHPGAA